MNTFHSFKPIFCLFFVFYCGLQTHAQEFWSVTSFGGEYKAGSIVRFVPSENFYETVYSFETPKYWDECLPVGPLWLAHNDKLYGTTIYGGLYGYGIVFEFDPKTLVMEKKKDFDPQIFLWKPTAFWMEEGNEIYGNTTETFSIPSYLAYNYKYDIKLDTLKVISPELYNHGIITKADNGKFYTADWNNIWECDQPGTDCILKFELGHRTGDNPFGYNIINPIMKGGNGKIYGETRQGGVYNKGVIFEWDPFLEKYSEILDLKSDQSMQQPFIQAKNENLYAFSNKPIKDNKYALVELDLASKEIITKLVFDSISSPEYLTLGRNGKLYGELFPNNVAVDAGKLFEWDPETEIYTIIHTFSVGESMPLGLTETCNHPTTSTLSPVVMNRYTSPSERYTWTTSGTYEDIIPNAFGCDSIITIKLTVLCPKYGTLTVTTCDSLVSPSGKFTWKEGGVYHDTIPTIFGCDSIITINLTAHIRTYSTISRITCDSLVSPSGKYTWGISGIYHDTIPNAMGCDSVITINFDKTNVNTDVIIDHQNLTASAGNGSYQWLFCQEGFNLIPGATGRSFMADQPGSYALIVQQDNCIDTSACYNIVISDVEVNSFKSLSYYPNPSDGSFTIDLGKIHDHTIVIISSNDGRILTEKAFDNARFLNMDIDLPPALYIVNVNSDTEQARFKALIK